MIGGMRRAIKNCSTTLTTLLSSNPPHVKIYSLFFVNHFSFIVLSFYFIDISVTKSNFLENRLKEHFNML